MKINEQILKFPKTLPNDLEKFLVFYPSKFPLIAEYYEEVAKKIATDPEAFREYGDWVQKELFAGFEKIKKEYESGDQNDISFLISIDQRFHKLFCYRFWIVNYLFPDGPLHDFYVDSLKNFIHKFVEVGDEVEEFEGKVVQIQRDLLQSDYADLYLQQALRGVSLIELLENHLEIKPMFDEIITLVDQHSSDNYQKINFLWDEIIDFIEKNESPDTLQIKSKLENSIIQAKMRKSMVPLYNMLTHAVEFREENKLLAKRNEAMTQRIDGLFKQAKKNLNNEEFKFFEISYQQSRNFAMYKDVMGEIDPHILPVWFGIHDKIRSILARTNKNMAKFFEGDNFNSGHSVVFYQLVWYLSDDLKAKVMTPDMTPFDLNTL